MKPQQNRKAFRSRGNGKRAGTRAPGADFLAEETAWAMKNMQRAYAQWLVGEATARQVAALAALPSHRARYERSLEMRAARERRSAPPAAERFWRRLEKCGMAAETLAEMNSMRAFLRKRPISAAECASGAVPAPDLRKYFRAAAFIRARRELAAESPRLSAEIFAGATLRQGGHPGPALRQIRRRATEIIRTAEKTTADS